MLVLSRRAGEAIVLAGNISIHVLDIEYDRVKLGVDAPADVLVLRSELLREQPQPQPLHPSPPHAEVQPPASSPASQSRRPRFEPRAPRSTRWSPDRYRP